jgi:hypothetical protein
VIIFSRTDLALAIAPSRIDDGSLTDSRTAEIFRAVPGAIGSVTHKQGLVMNSQKIAGTLAGIIGLIVLAVAFIYGPIGERNKPAKQVEKNDLAKAPVRGPVVREISQ